MIIVIDPGDRKYEKCEHSKENCSSLTDIAYTLKIIFDIKIRDIIISRGKGYDKIFLAEDEIVIRNSIKNSIDWEKEVDLEKLKVITGQLIIITRN